MCIGLSDVAVRRSSEFGDSRLTGEGGPEQ